MITSNCKIVKQYELAEMSDIHGLWRTAQLGGGMSVEAES
jgi:hypothetical protein